MKNIDSGAVEKNIDEHEVEKFAALAHEWWDENGRFKPLHKINALRLGYIIKKSGGDIRGKKFLDIGCGGGILSEAVARSGASVTGIDVAEASLAVAKLHSKKSDLKIDYQKTAAEKLAGSHAENFDIVACLEVLEHVPDPSALVLSAANLAKNGGHLFFSTINRNLKSYFLAIIGAEYILKMLPKGTHEWDKFIRPAELDAWAREAGLELQNLIGIIYNPISGNYRLGDDVDVNYISHYQKIAR